MNESESQTRRTTTLETANLVEITVGEEHPELISATIDKILQPTRMPGMLTVAQSGRLITVKTILADNLTVLGPIVAELQSDTEKRVNVQMFRQDKVDPEALFPQA